jgi:nucleotide-binding universal stress UspA family protein
MQGQVGHGGRVEAAIIVGVDGTCSGRIALEAAVERARTFDVPLVAVHVPPSPPTLWHLSADALAHTPQWRADLEAQAFLDTVAAAGLAGVTWSFTVAPGDPATVLRQQATRHRAGLTVVAAGAAHSRRHRCPARRLVQLGLQPLLVVGPGSRDHGR